MALPLRKDETLLHGWAWCRSRYRRVIVLSSAASQNAETVICACSLCRAPVLFCLRPANWAKHSFGSWLTAAAHRLHHNVLATALANKLARIAWTVLAQGRSYEAASSRERRKMSLLALTERTSKGDP